MEIDFRPMSRSACLIRLRRLHVEFDHEPVIRDTLQIQSSCGRGIALKDHERVYVDLHHLVSHIDGTSLHDHTLLAKCLGSGSSF